MCLNDPEMSILSILSILSIEFCGHGVLRTTPSISFRFVSYPTSSTRHRAHKLHRLTNNPCGLQHAHYLCFESVLCTVHRERKWPHVLYAGDQRAMV